MKIKNVLCAVLCLCLLSGCSGQPQQGTESGKPESAVHTSGQAEIATTTTAPTTAVEEKHSSPEKAVEEFCRAYGQGDIEAFKKIVPPDFVYLMNSRPDFISGLEEEFQSYHPFSMRVAEFRQNIEIEKGEEAYTYYLQAFTEIGSTNAEQITIYTVPYYVGEDLVDSGDDNWFYCVLEKGRWYAITVEFESPKNG